LRFFSDGNLDCLIPSGHLQGRLNPYDPSHQSLFVTPKVAKALDAAIAEKIRKLEQADEQLLKKARTA